MPYYDTSSYSNTSFYSSYDQSDYESLIDNERTASNSEISLLGFGCISVDDICRCSDVLEINNASGKYTYDGDNISATTASAVSHFRNAAKTKLSPVRYVETGSKGKNKNSDKSENTMTERGRSDVRDDIIELEQSFRNHSNKRYDGIRRALLSKDRNDVDEDCDNGVNENVCTINLSENDLQKRDDIKAENNQTNSCDDKKESKTNKSLLRKAMMKSKNINQNNHEKQRNLHALKNALPNFRRKHLTYNNKNTRFID